MIVIDKLRFSDPPLLAALDKRCFVIPWTENDFRDEFNNKLARYFIAREGNIIAGYAGYWEVCGEGNITNIAVDENYRRRHIGSRLMEEMIKSAIDKKLTLLTLEVRRSNAAAKELYKKYGFEEIGTRKGYYKDNREDAIIMTRIIRDLNEEARNNK